MTDLRFATIRIAAALIDDEAGRLLLVRKTGTSWFMQAGGKIEMGETALAALLRELAEEIGLRLVDGAHYLGRFSAAAANEAGHRVDAEIFHLRVPCSPIAPTPVAQNEIAETVWVSVAQAETMRLAPLTREIILPLARALGERAGRPSSAFDSECTPL